MNADIQAKLDVVTTPLKSMLEAVESIPALIDAGEQAKYGEGFEAGKKAIQLPAPNDPAAQYTQAQMNDAVNTGMEQVRGELGSKISSLEAELEAVKNQPAPTAPDNSAEIKAAVDAKVQELINEFADTNKDNDALVAKYRKSIDAPVEPNPAPDQVLGDKPTAQATAEPTLPTPAE